MLRWSHILHFYQPPTQNLALTETILQSCYLPLLDALERQPEAHFTINLCGSLLEQLEQISSHRFFDRLGALAQRGQIEVLQSPMFHVLLPLTPPDISRRQIKNNTAILQRLCGIAPINGLFPPELAVDQSIIEQFNDYDIILIDESSVNQQFSFDQIWWQTEPTKPAPGTKKTSAQTVVVSRTISEIIRSVPEAINANKLLDFIQLRAPANQTDVALVSLSDAEIFGHHYVHRLELLKQLLSSERCQFVTLTELRHSQPAQPTPAAATDQSLQIVASTWQTTATDLQHYNPFPLWDNPNNHLHRQFQQLTHLAIASLTDSATRNLTDSERIKAEAYLDRGLSSCHAFWLSNHPWWHPDLAAAGALLIIRAIRSLPLSHAQKKTAEELYHSFSLQLWHYHWSDTVTEGYARFDAQRDHLLKQLPSL